MKVFANIILSIVTVSILVMGAELVLRLRYSPDIGGSIFEYDKDKVYHLKANHEGVYAGTLVSTNSFGHRDSEISLIKERGTYRILVLGDSITFGHRMAPEDTYCEVLEKMLNEEPNNPRFDVINTATPGHSTFQEFYDLERGMKLDPDLVILQFSPNDVVEPYQVYRRYGGVGKNFQHVEDLTDMNSSLAWLHDRLTARSAIYAFLRDMHARVRFRDVSGQRVQELARLQEEYDVKKLVFNDADEHIQEAWKECYSWLGRIVNLVKEQDLPMILLVSPYRFQFALEEQLAIPQRRLERFSAENGVLFIDILTHLKADFHAEAIPGTDVSSDKTDSLVYQAGRKFWQSYFLDYDHFNENGHRYVAEKLYPVVQSLVSQEVS